MTHGDLGSLGQSIDIEVTSKEGTESLTSATAGEAPISWQNWTNLVAYLINTFVTYSSIAGLYGATNTELSKKYQTLVTPAGWAFSIWGPIFIWEAVFVGAQFLPQHRQSKTTLTISPWWWALCTAQCAWTFAFAQDVVPLALIFMLVILASLLGLSYQMDGQPMSTAEYFLLRAPFSLQLGWIIAASLVNISVQADALKSSQETLLALAIVSLAAVVALVSMFTFAANSPDAIVGIVGAWACGAISSELSNPKLLNSPTRFNPITWDPVVLGGVQKAALIVSFTSLTFAAIAGVSRVFGVRKA